MAASDRAGDDPDDEVHAHIATGDLNAAIRLLMRRHGDGVYRYCRGALRDSALADDVHQQVFIQAYRDLRRFAGRSTLRAWLFGIARHRVLDAAKARKRRRRWGAEEGLFDLVDPAPTAGECIDDAMLAAALVVCLRKLGERARTAVLLRFQQGFSFEEMAEVCREKAGTLRARVARAMPVLRSCIEERTGGAV